MILMKRPTELGHFFHGLRPRHGVALAAALLASSFALALAAQPADDEPAEPPNDQRPPPEQTPPPGPETTGQPPMVGPVGAERTLPTAPPAPVEESEAMAKTPDVPPGAHSDFMDTRLTWTFGDDDFTHQTGEAFPLSPNANVGDRPQYRLFFDNLNSRFSGRENISHIVLYSKLPGYIPRITTEAALVLRVNMSALASQSGSVNSVLEDAGTYLRVFYRTAGPEDKPEGMGVTLYPIDTDRFRLGYLYDISWGGTNARINQSIFPRLQGSAPGAKLQYDGTGWYVFGGFKTATIVEVQQRIVEGAGGEGAATDTVRVAETNYGFLGGAGGDITEFFHVDAGGGYFQQGRFEEPDVLGERVFTYGFSGRLVVHDKMSVPRSADFMLYRNDPNAPMRLFDPERYTPGELSWAFSLEGSQLHQRLKDFDRPGTLDIQLARAAAVQANMKFGYLRTSLSAIYRDLPFVLRNQPSFIPFQTIPDGAKVQDELFFAAATDYYIEGARLTPGIGAGLQFPATFSSDAVDMFGQQTLRTMVIREQGNITALPGGQERVPILQARASLKWDLSAMMSAVGWLQYRRDNNATKLELDPSGTVLLREFISPDFVGYGVALQARF
jgi:hypothetical protein